jgi:hypothetical protein
MIFSYGLIIALGDSCCFHLRNVYMNTIRSSFSLLQSPTDEFILMTYIFP